MNILLLGPQGCGKGTQAKRLRGYYNVPHISSGDLFRNHVRDRTAIGIKISESLNAGSLIDDNLTINMIQERLSKPDCVKGFILEGFPRTLNQAKALDGIAPPHAVIFLDLADDEAIERISGRRICPQCGFIYHILNLPPKSEGKCDQDGSVLVHRGDDHPDAISKRLAQYHAATEPLRKYYGQHNVLRTVNASQSPDQVFADILFKIRTELS